MTDGSDLTTADVVAEIDIFSDFKSSTIQEKIDEALIQVGKDDIDDSMKRIAALYYARHLLYVDYFMSTGGVTSSTTLGTEFTSVDMHNNDPYFQHYNKIVNDYGDDNSLGLAVTE